MACRTHSPNHANPRVSARGASWTRPHDRTAMVYKSATENGVFQSPGNPSIADGKKGYPLKMMPRAHQGNRIAAETITALAMYILLLPFDLPSIQILLNARHHASPAKMIVDSLNVIARARRLTATTSRERQ